MARLCSNDQKLYHWIEPEVRILNSKSNLGRTCCESEEHAEFVKQKV